MHRAHAQLIIHVERVGADIINAHPKIVDAIRNAIALVNPEIDLERVRISVRELDDDVTPVDRW